MQRIFLGPTRRTLLASPGSAVTLRGCSQSNVYRNTIQSGIAPPMPNATLPRRVSRRRARQVEGLRPLGRPSTVKSSGEGRGEEEFLAAPGMAECDVRVYTLRAAS